MTPSKHHVTCPQEIRKENRQHDNRKRERDPARKKAVKEWCKGKICTCGCEKPANCAHHASDTLYGDKWGDLAECEPYYSRCHYMHHKGYVRCPSCGGWMRQGYEVCFECSGLKEDLEVRKIRRQITQREIRGSQYQRAKEWKTAHPRTVKV